MKREGPGAVPALFVYADGMARRGDFLEGYIALHPVWMTLAWIVAFILFPVGQLHPVAFVASYALMIGSMWLWQAGVYRTSARVLGERIPEYEVILAIAAVGSIVAPVWSLFVQPTPGEPYELYESPVPHGVEAVRYVVDTLLLVWMMSFFASMWVAASSLVLFERQRVTPRPIYTVWATFIVAFYFPIGIWALSWRARRMVASYATASSNTPVRASPRNQD